MSTESNPGEISKQISRLAAEVKGFLEASSAPAYSSMVDKSNNELLVDFATENITKSQILDVADRFQNFLKDANSFASSTTGNSLSYEEKLELFKTINEIEIVFHDLAESKYQESLKNIALYNESQKEVSSTDSTSEQTRLGRDRLFLSAQRDGLEAIQKISGNPLNIEKTLDELNNGIEQSLERSKSIAMESNPFPNMEITEHQDRTRNFYDNLISDNKQHSIANKRDLSFAASGVLYFKFKDRWEENSRTPSALEIESKELYASLMANHSNSFVSGNKACDKALDDLKKDEAQLREFASSAFKETSEKMEQDKALLFGKPESETQDQIKGRLEKLEEYRKEFEFLKKLPGEHVTMASSNLGKLYHEMENTYKQLSPAKAASLETPLDRAIHQANDDMSPTFMERNDRNDRIANIVSQGWKDRDTAYHIASQVDAMKSSGEIKPAVHKSQGGVYETTLDHKYEIDTEQVAANMTAKGLEGESYMFVPRLGADGKPEYFQDENGKQIMKQDMLIFKPNDGKYELVGAHIFDPETGHSFGPELMAKIEDAKIKQKGIEEVSKGDGVKPNSVAQSAPAAAVNDGAGPDLGAASGKTPEVVKERVGGSEVPNAHDLAAQMQRNLTDKTPPHNRPPPIAQGHNPKVTPLQGH